MTGRSLLGDFHHQAVLRRRQRLMNLVFIALGLTMAVIFFVVRDFSGSRSAAQNLMPLYAVGGLALVVFCLVRHKQAMVILLLIAPVTASLSESLPFYLTPGDALLFILVVAWALRLLTYRDVKLQGTPIDRWVFLFITITFFSLLNDVHVDKGLKEFVQTIEYYVFAFYFFYNNIEDRKDIRAINLTLTAVGAVCSLNGVLEYFQGGGGSYRVTSFFGHFNAFGAFLALLIPYTFNVYLTEKNPRSRMVVLAAIALDIAALLFTFSRGSWIGAVTGVVLTGMVRGMVQFTKVFTAVVVGVIILSLVGSESIVGRAASITRFNDEASLSRFRQYEIARDIIVTHPFGVGLQNLVDYSEKKYGVNVGDVHNIFLHYGAERGIFALLVFCGMFVLFVRNMLVYSVRCRDEDMKSAIVGSLTAIVSFLIVNMTAYQLVRGVAMFFFCLFAMGYAVARIERLNEKSEKKVFSPRALR